MLRNPTVMRTLVAQVVAVLLACASVRPYQFTNYSVNTRALGRLIDSRVAVLPFQGDAGGRLADEFSIQVSRFGRFEVVERVRIQELWQEQDLDTLYRFDQASAVRIGRMLGAHAVFMGSVLEYRPGKAGLSLRLVAVETGEVVWQGSDILDARDARVKALVSAREDRARMMQDPDYLAMWLCRLLAETIS